MDTETDNKKPETPYKFCATTFLAAAGILLGATSALSAFLGNNLSKVIGVMYLQLKLLSLFNRLHNHSKYHHRSSKMSHFSTTAITSYYTQFH